MKQSFKLPGISCERCKDKLEVILETSGISITTLKVVCHQCGWNEDILDRGEHVLEESRKQLQGAAQQITKTLLALKNTLPKNRDEWTEVVTNPAHPFTATLLAALAILLMELSGFSIFIAATWILANLILNPLGWFLIPLVIAIVFSYRTYFQQERLSGLKAQLAELDQRRDKGELSQESYEVARNTLFAHFFK